MVCRIPPHDESIRLLSGGDERLRYRLRRASPVYRRLAGKESGDERLAFLHRPMFEKATGGIEHTTYSRVDTHLEGWRPNVAR
jgi:hypothetical protein